MSSGDGPAQPERNPEDAPGDGAPEPPNNNARRVILVVLFIIGAVIGAVLMSRQFDEADRVEDSFLTPTPAVSAAQFERDSELSDGGSSVKVVHAPPTVTLRLFTRSSPASTAVE